MAEVVYLLCAVTSLFCAILLYRQHRAARTRLLMWSTWCFIGLAINNILLFVDRVLVPDIDMSIIRGAVGLVAVALLLFGLLWEDT